MRYLRIYQKHQPRNALNELHLFAGAGGGILGGMLLGHTCVCAVEIEPYRRKVLLQRQRDGILPKFPIWDDVRTFDGRPWRGLVDVVCGGFPCQSYSNASSGRSVATKDLWHEYRRVVIDVRPRFVFAENVSRSAVYKASNDLREVGYASKICQVSAKDCGADHIRKRYWLLAHANMRGELRRSLNAKTRILPKLCTRVWGSITEELRVVDGVADRMDRLKAIGDGQVPAVVKLAWETLTA